MKSQNAFSLIEILVGIGVLSVLSYIGISTVQGVKDSAQRKKLENDVEILNRFLRYLFLFSTAVNAAHSINLHKGNWPNSEDDCR